MIRRFHKRVLLTENSSLLTKLSFNLSFIGDRPLNAALALPISVVFGSKCTGTVIFEPYPLFYVVFELHIFCAGLALMRRLFGF